MIYLRSLAFSDSTLFYKGVNGIYAYDGATPVCISRALGDARFHSACAGALDGRYYVSMYEQPTGTHALWVYDTQTGTWQREAAEPVRFFAGTGSDLYFACENGFIYAIKGSGLWYDPTKVVSTRLCLQETGFAWSAETGPVSLGMPERQLLTRVNLRYRLSSGLLRVWARLETDDAWRLLLQTSAACAERTVSMPAPPGRSSSFSLKIEGTGTCAITALSESFEAGSDV